MYASSSMFIWLPNPGQQCVLDSYTSAALHAGSAAAVVAGAGAEAFTAAPCFSVSPESTMSPRLSKTGLDVPAAISISNTSCRGRAQALALAQCLRAIVVRLVVSNSQHAGSGSVDY